MKNIQLAFWREINDNLDYKHLQEIPKEDLHYVVDYFLTQGYNVMIYTNGNLWVDKERFRQS